MAEDRAWDRIVDAIEAKFGIKTHGRTTRPVEEGSDLIEKVAYITFTRDGQDFKLERVEGPAIIDRKTIGAKRAGAVTHIQTVYDPTETSFKTNLFRKDENGEWQPLDPAALGL